MNFDWTSVEECEEELYMAENTSDEDFEEMFNWDSTDRSSLVKMFSQDLREMKIELEEEEMQEYAHHTIDENEAYADMRNFI